jgi:hypothetical protein
MPVRAVIQRGPKGKKAVAFAVDWPGWSRGAKTPELALELLESYRARYRPIAVSARMAREFDAAGPLGVVEDAVGPVPIAQQHCAMHNGEPWSLTPAGTVRPRCAAPSRFSTPSQPAAVA